MNYYLVADPGEGPAPPPPYFLHQTEARNKFFGDQASRYIRVWMTAPNPLSQGLDRERLLTYLYCH